jgi:serine/threonine-protein kinase
MTYAKNTRRELFEATVAMPPAERARWLDRHCLDPALRASIEGLLDAEATAAPHVLDRPLDERLAEMGDIDEPAFVVPEPGTKIGPFVLLEKLGEGGSSFVYRAEREQEGVRQSVALKLLRRGIYDRHDRRRFRDERRALAGLRHPGIAHLIEGGITDNGVPYIALELVEGTPITAFARERQLDLRCRLRLFVEICRAVAAAHRALIVHRDLKPSNTLVTPDGRVKLLDFGIAKLLDADTGPDSHPTRTGHGALTPAYAAPEQFSGAATTTATDVYSLGVLLDELVTGTRRAQGDVRTPSARIDANTEGEAGTSPAAPGLTRRTLRGDIDTIVMKATEVEPERRYTSAGALADDVERHLDGRPIEAHPPTRRYRLRKFVGRHRGGVAVTALFVLGILSALGIALWQADRARAQATRANAIRDFMVTAFREATPSVPRGPPPRITEVVQQAIDKARADPDMDRRVRAELLTELGVVLRMQGNPEQSLELLDWNHAQAVRDFGVENHLAIDSGYELAQTLVLQGDYDRARTLLDDLLPRSLAVDPELHTDLLHASARLATKQHDIARAEREDSEALAIDRALEDPERLAWALSFVANTRLSADDYEEAAILYREAIALRVAQYGQDHLSIATLRSGLSRALRLSGDLAGAEREARAAIAIDARVLKKDDWRRAKHLNALMMILRQQRDFAGALAMARESLRINRVALGDDHPDVASNLHSVGTLHTLLENYADAPPPLRESLERFATRFGPEHPETATTRAAYGYALANSGDWRAGEAELRHAVASLEANPRARPDDIGSTRQKLVRVLLDRHATAPALAEMDLLMRQVSRMESAARPIDHIAVLHAEALLQQGDPGAARAELAAATALAKESQPDPEIAAAVPLLQATAALRLDDRAAAADHLEHGASRLATLRNPPSRLRRLEADIRASLAQSE